MTKLSDKAKTTRSRILEAAEELFYLNGYTATGLDKIIKAAEITKGNFYYYFKSKEELALAVLDWHSEKIGIEAQAAMMAANSALERLFSVLDNIEMRENSHHDDGNIRGCFYGNFTLEMSINSLKIRNKLDAIFNGYRSLFKQLITEAQQEQKVEKNINAEDTAELMLSTIEGALILDKARQQPVALPNTIKFLKTYLQKA